MKIKHQYIILLSLLILTAAIVPNFWQLGMTGMVGFFLAYLSKGSRKPKKKVNLTTTDRRN
ncbi:hypothetical protein [Geminocystis sp. GBBB08]|uniref:hypothetical protein n=1 Tax=Geminocystis sp. GBBB08 TaxID=2604140 RepID=UPI0027E28045|nr:hypothetical protein [Geminocystis sp. GBBB08]MBL1210990.1 hypothetical protein [Geminocystis sp. GBBB08]